MVDAVAIMKKIKLNNNLKHSAAAIERTEVQPHEDDRCLYEIADFQALDLSPRLIVFDGLNNSSVVMLENISGSWQSGNGATIWDSSIVLTQYLLDHLDTVTGSRILELGSGLGLPSITLSKVNKCQIVASERPQVLDILKENCYYNFDFENSKYWQYKQSQYLDSENLHGSASKDSQMNGIKKMMPTLLSLDWTSPEDIDQIAEMGFDYVIGADLIFSSNKHTWIGLADIFKKVLQSSESENKFLDLNFVIESKKKRLGWLAYEPRDSSVFEEFFNVLLKERGVYYERVFNSSRLIPHDIHLFVLYCEHK